MKFLYNEDKEEACCKVHDNSGKCKAASIKETLGKGENSWTWISNKFIFWFLQLSLSRLNDLFWNIKFQLINFHDMHLHNFYIICLHFMMSFLRVKFSECGDDLFIYFNKLFEFPVFFSSFLSATIKKSRFLSHICNNKKALNRKKN